MPAEWHFSDDGKTIKDYDVKVGEHLFPAGFLQVGAEFVKFRVVVCYTPDLVHAVDHVDVGVVTGFVGHGFAVKAIFVKFVVHADHLPSCSTL